MDQARKNEMDEGQKAELLKAMNSAGLGNLMLERFIDRMLAGSCQAGCQEGCDQCCETGSANRMA